MRKLALIAILVTLCGVAGAQGVRTDEISLWPSYKDDYRKSAVSGFQTFVLYCRRCIKGKIKALGANAIQA